MRFHSTTGTAKCALNNRNALAICILSPAMPWVRGRKDSAPAAALPAQSDPLGNFREQCVRLSNARKKVGHMLLFK